MFIVPLVLVCVLIIGAIIMCWWFCGWFGIGIVIACPISISPGSGLFLVCCWIVWMICCCSCGLWCFRVFVSCPWLSIP